MATSPNPTTNNPPLELPSDGSFAALRKRLKELQLKINALLIVLEESKKKTNTVLKTSKKETDQSTPAQEPTPANSTEVEEAVKTEQLDKLSQDQIISFIRKTAKNKGIGDEQKAIRIIKFLKERGLSPNLLNDPKYQKIISENLFIEILSQSSILEASKTEQEVVSQPKVEESQPTPDLQPQLEETSTKRSRNPFVLSMSNLDPAQLNALEAKVNTASRDGVIKAIFGSADVTSTNVANERNKLIMRQSVKDVVDTAKNVGMIAIIGGVGVVTSPLTLPVMGAGLAVGVASKYAGKRVAKTYDRFKKRRRRIPLANFKQKLKQKVENGEITKEEARILLEKRKEKINNSYLRKKNLQLGIFIAKTRSKLRKDKKDDGNLQLIGRLLKNVFENTVDKFFGNAIENVKTTYRTAKTAITNSKLGRAVVNSTNAIVKGARYAGSYTRTASRGTLVGSAVGVNAVLAGASPQTAIALGVSSAIASNIIFATANYQTNTVKNLFTNRYGKWDPEVFNNVSNELNQKGFLEAKNKVITQNNIYSRQTRIFRSLDSALTFGAVGGLVAPLLGVNPLVGAVTGSLVGGVTKYVADWYFGRKIADYIIGANRPGILRHVLALPVNTITNQIVSQSWLGDQVRIIRDEYKGDIGQYFSKEWTLGEGGILGNIGVIGNYVGAVGYLASTGAMSQAMISFSNRIFYNPPFAKSSFAISNIQESFTTTSSFWRLNSQGGFVNGLKNIATSPFRSGISFVKGFALNPATLGAIGGGIVGTFIGQGLAVALLGPAALGPVASLAGAVGGAIGGGIGFVVGATVGSALGPIGTFVGSFIGTTIGTSIGEFFGRLLGSTVDTAIDKAVGGLTAGIMGLINLASSLQLLYRLSIGNFSLNNVLAFFMAFIALVSFAETAVKQSGDNLMIEDENNTSLYNNSLELSNYNVLLVDTLEKWSPDKIQIILNTLANIDFQSVNYKKVLLTIGENNQSFKNDDVLIISINKDLFENKYNQESLIAQTLLNTSPQIIELN